MRSFHVFSMAATLGLAACGGDDNPTQPIAPTQMELVTIGNFDAPMDVVSSPDGTMFYFSAHDTTLGPDAISTAAIFAVPSSGGAAEPIVTNVGQLGDPTGLLISCDGSTLYMADLSFQSLDVAHEDDVNKSALYTIDLATNALTELPTDGIGEAAGLAFNGDCSRLYVTGYTPAGEPALFSVMPEGGAATTVKSGSPLESPSGVYVDGDSVAWVMDQLPSNQLGGALFSIATDGSTSMVIDQLEIGEPAGVSLVYGGDIAVIPSLDIDGSGQLIMVSTSTGERTIMATPGMDEPAGIRTATQTSIMAVVDAEGDAIYRAQ